MIAFIALGAVAALVLLFIFLPVVAWILVGLVLLILALILFLPIGADVGYVDGELRLAVRADGFAIQLLPRKERGERKKPKKEKTEPPPQPEQEQAEEKPKKGKKLNLDFTVEEIFELLRRVLLGFGKFGKLTVRHFMLHYVAAGQDPYNTAITYNYVNAALSSLAPVCARVFHVKGDVDVWTDLDFSSEKMRLDAEVSLTLRVAQFAHMGLSVAFGALGVLLKSKLRTRREARAAKKQQSLENDTLMIMNNDPAETTRDEERKDTHG